MEIKLLRQHTHKGIVCPAGATLDIPRSKLKWFEENGIACENKLVMPAPIRETQSIAEPDEEEIDEVVKPKRSNRKSKRNMKP